MITQGISFLRRRGVFMAALLLCTQTLLAADRDHGLLWEISKPGGTSSYLFGTIHSEDPEILDLAKPVKDAFAGAASVVLEVMMDTDAMVYTSTAMLMTDGRLLSDILGQALFMQTVTAMQARGIPELVLERMKPWAVATSLAMPVPETGMVLDLVLYQQAQQAGKQVYGLETIREQLDVFDGMSLEDQVALVRDAVEQFAEVEDMHEALLDAYKQRDLGAMLAINKQVMDASDQRLARDFQRRLIIDRNRRMADRMQQYLKKGNAFVGVGALHLPGEQGLLELLEQRGYSVKRVY